MYAAIAVLLIGQPVVSGPPYVPGPPAALAVAQTQPQQKPNQTEQVFPAYSSTKGPVVVFVQCKPRKVEGVKACVESSFPDTDGPAIIVSPDGTQRIDLPATATDAEIRRAAGLEVSRAARPFRERRTADDKPKLPGRVSDLLGGAKFYDLPPRYQNLWTENNGRFHGWSADDLHHESAEFTVSGGMVGLSGWKSRKAIQIPDGKSVAVWKELTDVRAFSLVPRWRWRFPEGTKAFDVLLNDNDEVFEVRQQIRNEDGWESRIVYKDADAAPTNYHGAGKACASCHSTAGQVFSVPGRIYLRTRWGDDGRFSWRPFNDDGTLDESWPTSRI